MTKRIYLDNAATTPVDEEVLNAMLPYFSEKFGNASSLHSFGQEASEAVEESRKTLAGFFNAAPEEIIFTSGATESNNLAIKGVIRAYLRDEKNKDVKPHIITTAFEHSCILKTCQNLEKEGTAEVTYLPVYSDGIVRAKDVKNAIKENTILVSVMYVNNEIGTVQPIAEIGKIISERRNASKDKAYPLFHTDATQAVNYFDCNVENIGVDLLSMSAHKIYGPKGVGALYIKKGTRIRQVQDGGEQESGKRAGTLNSPGIVGLGRAVALVEENRKKDIKRMELLRDYMIDRVTKEIPKTRLNGSAEKRSPNNANFSFRDVEGESLLLYLDMEGIACSTGSACSSGSLDPSHVLLAIGLKHEDAHGSLRVTLGRHTTKREIETFIEKLKRVIEKLRKVSGDILQEYYENKKDSNVSCCDNH